MVVLIFACVVAISGVVGVGRSAWAKPPDAPSADPKGPVSLGEGDVFDEAGLKRRYDAWLIRWLTEPIVDPDRPYHHPESPFSAIREELAPLPSVARWPIDPARGMLANDIRKRPNAIEWMLEGESEALDPPPANMDWMSIALMDWDHPGAIRAVMCVPEACYFKSDVVSPTRGRPLVRKPGIWLALREHKGKDVIAGILIHKTAPPRPLEDRLFKSWLAELGTRFPKASR